MVNWIGEFVMRRYVDLMICPESKDALRDMLAFIDKIKLEVMGICVNEESAKEMIEYMVNESLIDRFIIFYMIKAEEIEEFREKKKKFINQMKKYKGVKALILESRNYKVLRYAVDKREVDALYNLPLSFKMFGVDQVIIKLCSEKNIALIFDFNSFKRMSKNERVVYLRNMRKILQIAKKYDTMSIAVSCARNVMEIKHPRDLASFFYIVYRNLEFSLKSTSDNPLQFSDFIKKLNNSKRVLPGLYIIEDDSNVKAEFKR